MKKKYRVKKSSDIEKIIKARKGMRNKYFKLYKRKNHDVAHFRFAISVPKKFGKAHARNLMKRRIRMIISQQKIISNIDFFIIVNAEAALLSYQEIEKFLTQLLEKHQLLEVN